MENNEKDTKKKGYLALLIIVVVLGFVLGFVVGNKTKEKPAETKETVKDSEKAQSQEENNLDKIENDKDQDLVKKAYGIIPKSYEVAYPFYVGKKVNLTKLSAEDKMAWILYTLPEEYEIPYCNNEDDLAISEEDMLKYSLFEDNSFLNTIKNKYKKINDGSTFYSNYGDVDGSHSTYYATYEKGKYYVGNSNCDGRGTGVVAFEEFAYDSYKIENDKLFVTVRFAYFEPIIPDPWPEDVEYSDYDFKFKVFDSYDENANVIMDEINAEGIKLNDKNSVKYQFTFKIDGDKLYPLSVEKL